MKRRTLALILAAALTFKTGHFAIQCTKMLNDKFED